MGATAAASIEQRLFVYLYQGLVILPAKYALAFLGVNPTCAERLEKAHI